MNNNDNNLNSELKRSEKSIDILISILNSMDAYVYVTDPETDDMLFINDKMREHFDFEEDKGVGKKCWEVLQEGMTGRCDFCPIYQLTDNPDETITWDEQNSVTKRYYRNNDKFINWPDGRRVHMQHSVDITEMKEASAALEQKIAEQDLMSKVSQCFIFGNDIDDMADSALELLGENTDYARILLTFRLKADKKLWATHKWISKEIEDKPFVDTTSFKKGDYLFDRINKEGKTVVVTDPAHLKEHFNGGEAGIKSYLASPVYFKEELLGFLEFASTDEDYDWDQGAINMAEFLCGIFSGVFDRKQANDNLKKINTLVENTMQPIVYIDIKENVTYYNAATYKVFGYTEEELVAGGLELLFGKETYEMVRTEVWPVAFEDGRVDGIELPLIHKDGRVLIFSFLGVVMNIKGELPQLATIGSDITDLVESMQAAESANKSKGDFLARMSHEIRTPMNAIIGMTSIAQGSDDADRKKYCLEKISGASRHLLGVINDILDMSKIEANKFEISTTEFELESMLINISNMVSFRIDEKNHNFIIKFEPDIPRYIISDEQRLSQVIVNLLSNAVKFTPEDGMISLHVELIEETDKDVRLKFVVSDTGIGIAPDQQDKLFTSFEQADGSISRKFGGTGLGLAISKRIVELMGGEIYIESTLGEGTSVIFDILAEKGLNNEHPKLSHSIERDDLRILVVDDSKDTLEYFNHLLSVNNLDYDVAESGEEAVLMIDASEEADKPYNFFFIDWKMPGMDGIELTQKIKDRIPDKSVVIMISASHWSEIEAEATEAGVDNYISKPLFPSSIVDSINSRLTIESNTKQSDIIVESINDFSKFTILLVEDVEVNREIVMAMLEDTYINIETAENGVEAVEKFLANGEKYDLIFMDIHMPIMDGYEATKTIRSSDVNNANTIPIIAMTANAFKEDVDRCMEYGMNSHIAKPIDRKDMIDKMLPWLKLKKKEN